MTKQECKDQHPDLYTLFYGKKDDWYTTDKDGTQQWDEEKVYEFWEAIREHKMKYEDYDFSKMIFPKSLDEYDYDKMKHNSNSFWLGEENREFKGESNFSFTSFAGQTDFNFSSFSGNADFSSASFAGDADFSFASFTGYTNFSFNSFTGYANFGYASFTWYVDISSALFAGNADFVSASFARNADFSSASFVGPTDFGDASFSGYAYFRSASFTGYANFSSAKFADVLDFTNVVCKERVDFKGATFTNEVRMEGAEMSFLKNLDAKGVDLSEAVLEETHFYGIPTLERYNFRGAFLLSLSLAGKSLVGCDLSGAVIGGVHTQGWQPDADTLARTTHIYTDYTTATTTDEHGNERTTYHAIETSRVPAEGNFGHGDNEGFTIQNYLHEPVKWSYSPDLPTEIRSGFLSYIQFFTDFAKATANKEIEIRTRTEGKRVRVEFITASAEDKAFIENEFKKYINNLGEKFENLDITVSESMSEVEKDLFMIKYENQINNLRTELKYTQRLLASERRYNRTLERTNDILAGNVDKLLPSTTILPEEDRKLINELISVIKDALGEVDEAKQKVVEEVIEELKEVTEGKKPPSAKFKKFLRDLAVPITVSTAKEFIKKLFNDISNS